MHAQPGRLCAACKTFTCLPPTSRLALLQALKERGVSYIVAPYEADAQMAYLALQGHVHAIITEDSDLLAYGCPRVCSFASMAPQRSSLLPAALSSATLYHALQQYHAHHAHLLAQHLP